MRKKRIKQAKPTQKIENISWPPKDAGPDLSKRNSMRKFGNLALGAVALGGIGYWSVDGIQACAAEMDLSRVGNGMPTLVQIHDPNCPVCMGLQKETRAALSEIEDGQLQYLVANIRTAYGRKFANSHSVGHVTLLLFDGEGNLAGKLEGTRYREELLIAFKAHLRNSS